MKRVYLDWNATAPLRPEARAAMLAAMDCLGNPSSVHAEGRAAKAIVEKARGQVADLVGCDRDEVVFTSSATESAHLVLRGAGWGDVAAANSEHGAVLQNIRLDEEEVQEDEYALVSTHFELKLDTHGRPQFENWTHDLCAVALANNETGVINNLEDFVEKTGGDVFSDITQALGKIELPEVIQKVRYLIGSSHKMGGPKGAGVAVLKGVELGVILGGGQEKGRRSGTENVIGIAGMGAAAEAAAKDLENGLWQIVEQNRNVFEARLLNAVPELIIFGRDVMRLPNTSYFAVPGWKAETQVMQMDLAGFAVSAGSACSSGKVKASRVLKAMGYDEITAGSAIRVSIGPSTTAAELESFADAWLAEYKRFKARQKGK